MNKIKIHLVLILVTIYISAGAQPNSWMKEAKLGLMSHYLAERLPKEKRNIDSWNGLVNKFDVKGLAKQLDSLKIDYLIFTIGQYSGFYCSPNKIYDQIVGINPSKCSKRDLVKDLYTELAKYNIRLIVYLPSEAPENDSIAVKNLKWEKGPYPNKIFQQNWEAIIKEYSARWGKNVSGWWFDDCHYPNIMYRSESVPNFSSFSRAAKIGNNNSVIAFNPGLFNRTFSITPEEDYTAGEINDLSLVKFAYLYDGKVDGRQLHILSYLGTNWGSGLPRYDTQKLIDLTKSVTGKKGLMTWDVPVMNSGLISTTYMQQLKTLTSEINKNRVLLNK